MDIRYKCVLYDLYSHECYMICIQICALDLITWTCWMTSSIYVIYAIYWDLHVICYMNMLSMTWYRWKVMFLHRYWFSNVPHVICIHTGLNEDVVIIMLLCLQIIQKILGLTQKTFESIFVRYWPANYTSIQESRGDTWLVLSQHIKGNTKAYSYVYVT